MEQKLLSEAEASEYSEFKRMKREEEVALTLKKLVVDASHREADRAALVRAVEAAKRLHARSVLVSPVNVTRVRKLLSGNGAISCVVGGTGESLTAIKKAETKRAVKQGAREIRLVLCYSQLIGGNLSYLKREIKRVKRAARGRTLTVLLTDRTLTKEQIVLGVKAARLGKADGVAVSGETQNVSAAVEAAMGKLTVEAAGVENSLQLRMLIKAGAGGATTESGEKILFELLSALDHAP